MSNVRSEPLENGKQVSNRPSLPKPDFTSLGLAWRALGLVAIAIGGSLWLVGARYTVFGAPRVIAILAGLFDIVVELVLPTGWQLLWTTIVVGSLASLVEFGCRPRRTFFAKSLIGASVLFVVWAIVNTGDWLSTFVAVTTETPGLNPLGRWVATNIAPAIAWTTVLTYIPELLIIGGAYWIIKGRF